MWRSTQIQIKFIVFKEIHFAIGIGMMQRFISIDKKCYIAW